MTSSALPRSHPSDQGVDAAGILAFLDGLESSGMELHSLMMLRHGHVVAEGWWAPYRADRMHPLFSLSKSFTSTAIGIAEGEGLLSIDDLVSSFFPDQMPADPAAYMAGMRVRHLLAMASGHAEETWDRVVAGGGDLVRTFLSLPPEQEPGTLFCYNQSCPYTLSAIITRLTGRRLVDYLRPRLFDPLGIEHVHWRQSHEGIDQGFAGLHLVTESIAKLGQLYLQGGRWNGQQLIPQKYVAGATTRRVDNSPGQQGPDWQQGYGFQFWMCRHDAYRGDGAFGQFCIVLPAQDAVIACTADIVDMQRLADLMWQHLLPALSGRTPRPTASPSPAEVQLADRLGNLVTAVIEAGSDSPEGTVTFTRVGEPVRYAGDLSTIRVEPHAGGTRLRIVVAGAEHSFDLQPGSWNEGELAGMSGFPPPVAVSGGWTSRTEFRADIVFLGTPETDTSWIGIGPPHRLRLRARAGRTPTFDASWGGD